MKTPATYLILLCLGFALYPGCKKSKNSSLTPFAISLRNTCTAPFVGHGDSSNLYLTTAFTPNGDGLDDFYGLAQGNHGSFSSFLIKIYDTTGTLVFQSTHASSLIWDGTDMTTGTQSKKYKFYVKINYTTAGNITDSGSTYVFLLASDSARTCVKAVAADTSKYEFAGQFLPGTGFDPHSAVYETYCH